MHCQAELRLASSAQLKAVRRRYKTFMIDEILSKETCDYFEKLSLYSVCPSLIVRPKPLHSCPGKWRQFAGFQEILLFISLLEMLHSTGFNIFHFLCLLFDFYICNHNWKNNNNTCTALQIQPKLKTDAFNFLNFIAITNRPK